MRSDGYYCTWPARKVIDKGLHGILRTYLRINDLRYDPVFEDTWEEVDLYYWTEYTPGDPIPGMEYTKKEYMKVLRDAELEPPGTT